MNCVSMRSWGAKTALAVLMAGLLVLSGCSASERPSNVQIITLRGSPYERGFQHGEQLSAHIRSLHTKLLTSSIMPFLNREQTNIAPVLPVYGQPEYLDGQFSSRMLLESGQHLYDNYLPEAYKQEMHGIADGAGMAFEDVLVLNTFVDTMLGFRAIVVFIQGIQDPFISSVTFVGLLSSDGVDNDGDGEIDEAEEGRLEPYQPLPHAAQVEVPLDAKVRVVIEDINLPGLACMDPRNVRPLADMVVERACLIDDCVLADCRDHERIGRDCLTKLALNCIDPRIATDCLVEGCMELTDPGCVDPESIRLVLDGQLYLASDEAVEINLLPAVEPLPADVDESCFGPLEVVFSPPGGLAPASLVSLVVQAGDSSPIYSPAPFHSRYMRDERIVFTSAGYAAANGTGAFPYQVQNRGVRDPNSQPPSLSFAVRGSATPDGAPLLANHYALLDSDMVHEHSVLFVHIPDEGHPHAVLSWAGLVWGFAGMNDQGLTYSINNSDTLDNPLVGGVLETMFEPQNLAELMMNPNLRGLAKVLADTHLYATGLPTGIAGRELLTHHATVPEGLELLYRSGRTYGWNVLLADAQGGLLALESDGATQYPESGTAPVPVNEDGFAFYGPDLAEPENVDPYGRAWASVGPDDVRMASHFHKAVDDMPELALLGPFGPERQQVWSSYYYRSLRAFYVLGEQIDARYGEIDAPEAIDILRTPDLVDIRDSMEACVFEPAAGVLHWAMGGVPATDQPFEEFDLSAHLQAEGGQ